MLCGKCNTALGLFNDDLCLLRRAVLYLLRSTDGICHRDE